MPSPRPKLSDDQLRELARLYEAGVSAEDLAERFDVSDFLVRRWLRRLDVAVRPRGRPLGSGRKVSLDVVQALRARGLAKRQIAELCGVHVATVAARLAEATEQVLYCRAGGHSYTRPKQCGAPPRSCARCRRAAIERAQARLAAA